MVGMMGGGGALEAVMGMVIEGLDMTTRMNVKEAGLVMLKKGLRVGTLAVNLVAIQVVHLTGMRAVILTMMLQMRGAREKA